MSENIYEQLPLIVVIYCMENWIKLFRNQIGLLFLLKHKITLFYLLSFVFICFITCCHSLSLIVIFCYRCHSLSFAVSCCTTRCHRWITRCHSLCHSMSLVPLIAMRRTTCCHSLSLVVIRCHSIYHSSVFLQTIIISYVFTFYIIYN